MATATPNKPTRERRGVLSSGFPGADIARNTHAHKHGGEFRVSGQKFPGSILFGDAPAHRDVPTTSTAHVDAHTQVVTHCVYAFRHTRSVAPPRRARAEVRRTAVRKCIVLICFFFVAPRTCSFLRLPWARSVCPIRTDKTVWPTRTILRKKLEACRLKSTRNAKKS